MFRTKYDLDKRTITETCPGDPIKIEYQLRVKDNEEVLEPVGKTNLYEYIQSHADSVDIHKILERCALIDDYSMLNQMPTQFIDTVNMPHSLAEAYAQIKDAEEFFNRMPTDIKENYNNNFVEFISDIGSKKFYNIVGDYIDKSKVNVVNDSNIKEDVKNES